MISMILFVCFKTVLMNPFDKQCWMARLQQDTRLLVLTRIHTYNYIYIYIYIIYIYIYPLSILYTTLFYINYLSIITHPHHCANGEPPRHRNVADVLSVSQLSSSKVRAQFGSDSSSKTLPKLGENDLVYCWVYEGFDVIYIYISYIYIYIYNFI